jgi:hypothetical protein
MGLNPSVLQIQMDLLYLPPMMMMMLNEYGAFMELLDSLTQIISRRVAFFTAAICIYIFSRTLYFWTYWHHGCYLKFLGNIAIHKCIVFNCFITNINSMPLYDLFHKFCATLELMTVTEISKIGYIRHLDTNCHCH